MNGANLRIAARNLHDEGVDVMSFQVRWLKPHKHIERAVGEVFPMDDRALFEAWKADGWCEEVKTKQKRAQFTKPARSNVTK